MLVSFKLPSAVAYRSSRHFAKAIVSRHRVSIEASHGLQRFPGGVWAVVRPSSSGVLLEAGWLLAPNLRRVSSREFAADGRLLHTTLATERRGSTAGVQPQPQHTPPTCAQTTPIIVRHSHAILGHSAPMRLHACVSSPA